MKLGQSEILFLDLLRKATVKLSRASLAQKLEDNGLPSSPATITRMIDRIELELDMKIVNENQIYRIENDPFDPDFRKTWADYEAYRTSFYTYEMLRLKTADRKKNIDFYNHGQNKNMHFLKPILGALNAHKEIKIDYLSFTATQKTSYTIRPLMIKEYLNRWYVVADAQKLNDDEWVEAKAFPLDRIESLDVVETTFKAKNIAYLHDKFEHCIGFPWEKTEVEEVKLWISESQYPYLKTLKLHHSQKEIEPQADGVIISLQVMCNFELEQHILFHGEHIEVLEPLYLREHIQNRLQKSLAKYQK